MKLSLASAGVAAGLVTLGWVIFGEQDAKNAEAEEKSWDDYPESSKMIPFLTILTLTLILTTWPMWRINIAFGKTRLLKNG